MISYAVRIVSFCVACRIANAAIDFALDKGAEAIAKLNATKSDSGAEAQAKHA